MNHQPGLVRARGARRVATDEGPHRARELLMIDPVKTQIERFLHSHCAEIQQLMLLAQQEARGHYAALSQAARQQQAEIDADEFVQALLSGAPDHATIQQTLDNAPRATIATDIVNMATALDRLFTAFVSEEL